MRSPTAINAVQRFDERIFRSLARSQGSWLDGPLSRVNSASERSKLSLGIAAVLALTGGAPGRRAATRGVACLATSLVLTNGVLKPSVGRSRPDLGLLSRARTIARRRGSASFPSAHAAGSAGFATGVAVELPWLGGPLGALACAVGYSPIHMGMHHPLDVVGGWGLGAAVGLLSRRIVPGPAQPPPSQVAGQPGGW
ncbi:MAG: phosphatase PAP2 family protein [Chloroflexota bacterium]|nr:phosphatase PAP2 family protein [Chloroflexota bacterium]